VHLHVRPCAARFQRACQTARGAPRQPPAASTNSKRRRGRSRPAVLLAVLSEAGCFIALFYWANSREQHESAHCATMRQYILACDYCKFTTHCRWAHDDEAQRRCHEHEQKHHSCEFCGWWPSNGRGRDHWVPSLARHVANCKAQIQGCKYCDYMPKTMSKYKNMHDHVFRAHFKPGHPCCLCGWMPGNMQEWEQEHCLHDEHKKVVEFLFLDVGLNRDVVEKIAALQ
jgi:hypothetical protein